MDKPRVELADPAASGREVDRMAELDGVRGLAALVVVIHHCLLTQPAFSDYFFSNWRMAAHTPVQAVLFDTPGRLVWSGYEAVILFYVLSGLVLALPWMDARPPSYRVYVIKRFCRIYLPYLAAVGVSAVLSAALTQRLPIGGLSDWVNMMNWSWPVTPGVLLNHLFLTGHHNVLDGPIHSLVWEMRVSILFPLIVVPIMLWGVGGAGIVVAALLAVIASTQLLFSGDTGLWRLLTVNPGLGVLGKLALEVEWTAFFALFFVMGVLVLRFLRTGIGAGWPKFLPWGMLVVGLAMVQTHWSHLEFVQDMMVGFGSCAIIVACAVPGRLRGALSSRVPAWLGAISYSLYLIHVPLLLAALIVLRDVVPVWVILVAAVPASIAAAWSFDVVVTRPCARLGRTLARRAMSHHMVGQRVRMTAVAERS